MQISRAGCGFIRLVQTSVQLMPFSTVTGRLHRHQSIARMIGKATRLHGFFSAFFQLDLV